MYRQDTINENTKHKKISMGWLEIIELRSANCECGDLKPQLQKLSDEMNKEAREQTIKVYSSIRFGADFSIHLFHKSNKAAYYGSPLGLQLASALKEFGLVNHSIWVEMNNNN